MELSRDVALKEGYSVIIGFTGPFMLQTFLHHLCEAMYWKNACLCVHHEQIWKRQLVSNIVQFCNGVWDWPWGGLPAACFTVWLCVCVCVWCQVVSFCVCRVVWWWCVSVCVCVWVVLFAVHVQAVLLFFFYFADPVQKVSLSCSNLSKSVGKFPWYVAGGLFMYEGKQML